MSVIYILISISTLVASIFLVLCIRAIKSGQFDDVHTPAVRMLFDDELVEQSNKPTTERAENQVKH